MFWAIEQSGVELGKADIAALAADIVSTWRACRRGMQRHHECDEIVGAHVARPLRAGCGFGH